MYETMSPNGREWLHPVWIAEFLIKANGMRYGTDQLADLSRRTHTPFRGRENQITPLVPDQDGMEIPLEGFGTPVPTKNGSWLHSEHGEKPRRVALLLLARMIVLLRSISIDILRPSLAPYDCNTEGWLLSRITKQAVLNIYLTPMRGGKTTLYDVQWSEDALRYRDSDTYGYHPAIVDGQKSYTIDVQVGDMYIFNSRGMHQVRPIEHHEGGPGRLALASFMGFLPQKRGADPSSCSGLDCSESPLILLLTAAGASIIGR
ncbi:Hypothetical protein R9X50_00469800 [Acrodontium crateriforme]|uniref:Fe2OG dioxygenase domain-containing protein n=1 Tax=Acrodontium crateriforme TaxID=150365 RepID=A0AAQ3R8K6_9PEZI|nr:Hypothetical protein R9X50_00469800 [Acrodontium crateriforme]